MLSHAGFDAILLKCCMRVHLLSVQINHRRIQCTLQYGIQIIRAELGLLESFVHLVPSRVGLQNKYTALIKMTA